MYKLLLVAHILGVFLIVGGAAIATALGIKTSKLSRTQTVAELTGLSIIAERFVITPGAILALVAGSLLVHEAGYTFDAFWIVAAYVLWVIAISVGLGPLGRHTVRLHQHAERLIAAGVDESDELRAHAAAPLATALGLLQNLILLAFIYLMVVRPGS
ncbi:MAG: DUF2269 family protein [Actinobacteria bacterium]|nr:DUF2269 family protein [Actinomycetota bacterium]